MSIAGAPGLMRWVRNLLAILRSFVSTSEILSCGQQPLVSQIVAAIFSDRLFQLTVRARTIVV
jgi:hypothetical protein